MNGAALRALWIVVAILAIGSAAFFWGGVFLRGWLVAAGLWTSFCVGSLVLLMILRLTGGGWGEALGPVLRVGSLAVPASILVMAPIAFDLGAVYPWAVHPDLAASGVAQHYLAPTLFDVRAAITLAGWSVLGVVFGLDAGGALLAGLGLAFYGVTISLVSVDWFLSPAPDHPSTTFGAMIAIQQLMTALCVGALLSPVDFARKVSNDIGGLLIATLLGTFYLELMTYIVLWYGNVPSKVKWYVARADAGWPLVAGVLTALTAIAFLLLVSRSGRENRLVLRLASAALLLAVAIHFAWLIIPSYPDGRIATIVAAVLSVVGVVAATLAFTLRLTAPEGGARVEI